MDLLMESGEWISGEARRLLKLARVQAAEAGIPIDGSWRLKSWLEEVRPGVFQLRGFWEPREIEFIDGDPVRRAALEGPA
jgi:hypothetical protein